jgi:hypothetical protein
MTDWDEGGDRKIEQAEVGVNRFDFVKQQVPTGIGTGMVWNTPNTTWSNQPGQSLYVGASTIAPPPVG